MTIIRLLVSVAATLLLTLPAAARAGDPTYWLVLRDGRRLAASGALEMNGGLARFRTVGGTFCSLPLDQVDVAATRATSSTPRQARNLALRDPEAQKTSPVGLAGEAAKRSGRRGSFIDLTQVVVPRVAPAPAAPDARPTAPGKAVPSEAAASRRRPSRQARQLDDPEKLLRLRLRRAPKP